MRSARFVALVALMALLTSGCTFLPLALQMEQNDPTSRPWFCTATEASSVTGPGMGTVNFYVGKTKGDLSWSDCKTVAAQLDLARDFATSHPTAADAEADGFYRTMNYIPGMGTHHGNGAVTPERLHDPTFDRFNPTFPGSAIDGTFDPIRPEFLQYDGNGPTARLVGMSWYVYNPGGTPPEGFAGGNDWWHHHPTLCLSNVDARVVGVNTTDTQCTNQNGVNVYMSNYYMLHAWVVPDMEWHQEVNAPMIACITGGGAIFDMNDPCHGTSGGAAPEAVAATATKESFCGLGLLDPALTSAVAPGT